MTKAVIIGAGPAGLATSLALRSAGLSTAVFERSADRHAGTALTLWPNAFAALAAFGADGPVLKAGRAATGNQIRNSAGRVLDDVPDAVMRDRFGGNGVALRRSDLASALLDQHGPVSTGMQCVGYRTTSAGVLACFADGSQVEADLLIGADGLRSTVREVLLGEANRLRYAGSPVWRGVTRYSLPAGPGLLTMGAGAQFGLFGLDETHVYWFASVPMAEGEAHTFPALPYLRRRFSGWHHPIGEVMAAAQPADITITDIYDRAPLPKWTASRVALVGDAAHPSPPNMGQGTCQAFEDAAVLGHVLSRFDVRKGLVEYEKARRKRADGISKQARQLGQIGKWRNPVVCWLRDQLMTRLPQEPRLRQMRRMFEFSCD